MNPFSGLVRARRVVNSVKDSEQIDAARNYVKLAHKTAKKYTDINDWKTQNMIDFEYDSLNSMLWGK